MSTCSVLLLALAGCFPDAPFEIPSFSATVSVESENGTGVSGRRTASSALALLD